MSALQGKIAIVTGSSRGIGRAIAEQLAADGATTIVTFHQQAEAGEQVVRAIEQAGGRARAARLDVREIEQFSMALAKELGARQITVNTVLPGVTATDGLVLGVEQLGYLTAQTPLGRLDRPSDIARVVAWLASPNAGWMTGQNIRATGGII